MTFTGPAKVEFCRRLGPEWRSLADYFGIAHDEQDRIAREHAGAEGRGIWAWLEQRRRLAELPEALAYIGRADLQELLEPEVTLPDRAPARWPGRPYPGLQWFRPQDAPIFFGREAEADQLLARLRDDGHRFIAVVGASGSGKSSLVAAGLIPRLKALRAGADWPWHRLTPGEAPAHPANPQCDPFLALAIALKPELEARGYDVGTIHRQLRSSPNLQPLVEQALAGRDGVELFLFLDQFEELFTQVAPADRLPFSVLLRGLAATPRLRTVLTLRADFYHHCLALPPLTELLGRYTFLLGPPDSPALMAMITGPAAVAGLTFEDGLVSRILRDTGTAPGALALMAYALATLHERCRGGTRLTREAYDAFQGVRGAIGRKAEEAFESLSGDAQAALGAVFKELVDVDPDTGTPTRKRAPRVRFSGAPAAEEFIATFQQHRLLVGDDPGRETALVEVAHEALLSHWPRLNQWIAERLDDFRRLHHFRLEAKEWQRLGGRASHRWKHERLADLAAVVARLDPDLSAVEREFLRPEAESLLEELNRGETPPQRRAAIGERLAEIGDPRPGVGLDDGGLPAFVWLPVPPGQITLTIEGKREGRVFDLAPFEISKFAVTWAQYRAFLEAKDGHRNSQWWKGLAEREKQPGTQWRPLDNHPAEHVSWYDAVAYSRWLSRKLRAEIRLPTEWEWQFAATRGQSGFEYPWGPEWRENHANTYETGINRTTAVGLFPNGVSPVRALDLSGNVWEWCLNQYEDFENTTTSGANPRVLRGGSWYDALVYARATFRARFVPGSRYSFVGVRLVRLSPIFK